MIGRPHPGPTEPAPPEPAPYLPPRMTTWVPEATPLVRRITDAGFAEIIPWLVPRLMEDRPAADPGAVAAWLRAMANDRATFLMRTPDMVALAEVRRTTLLPAGIVSEVFVRSRVPNNEEAIALYRAMRDWAMTIGAAEFHMNIDSDAAMTHVIPALFDLNRDIAPKKRSLYVAALRRTVAT